MLRLSPTPRSILTLLIALGSACQSGAQDSAMNVSISVGSAVIPFVARDAKGMPVNGITAAQVELFVDGRRVATDLFDHGNSAPVSFTILLDASGSMGLAGKMEGAIAALRELVAQRVEGDDYSLYAFAKGEVREIVPFTSNGASVLQAAQSIEPWGKTAFYDALARMPDKTILGSNGTTAIILLTDGFDNASSFSREGFDSLLRGIEVPVYPFGLRERAEVFANLQNNKEAMVDLEILGQIARASGGRLSIATDPAELREGIRSMQRDLRSQYIIGFSPTGRGGHRYHAVTIAVKNRRVKSIVARAGYNGSEPRWTDPPGSVIESKQSKP